MKPISGQNRRVSMLDKHEYICDLINIEGPLLSLFRDHRNNWLYLWCDTDGNSTERWAIFNVSRSVLAEYLQKNISLRDSLCEAKELYCLEVNSSVLDGRTKKTRKLISLEPIALKEYWPATDSFFDEEYSEDISLDEQIAPSKYHVPIDGEWFVSDLDQFARTYSSLYSFFYCTAPRFITNIDSRVQRFLRSPWTGGFSRINLFDALERMIPSIHDMKINRFKYASPGSIQIEALPSVGKSIASVIEQYLYSELSISQAVKAINQSLSASKVKTTDLSAIDNKDLQIGKEVIALLEQKTVLIGELLQANSELQQLINNAPNIVVGAKAVLAVVKQIERLAGYQKTGMLDVRRVIADDSDSGMVTQPSQLAEIMIEQRSPSSGIDQ